MTGRERLVEAEARRSSCDPSATISLLVVRYQGDKMRRPMKSDGPAFPRNRLSFGLNGHGRSKLPLLISTMRRLRAEQSYGCSELRDRTAEEDTLTASKVNILQSKPALNA